MALPNLASSSDLTARDVDVTNAALVAVMLAVASSVVRQAAQSPILATDATIKFGVVERDPWLDLPVRPVTAVDSVALDGVAITDWKLVDGNLWRSRGWVTCEPVVATVALSCGLPTVPDHIKQLVCDLAILGIDTATVGAIDPRVVAERIDDYSVTFAAGAQAVASAMTVPPATRHSLRAQFGGGVGSVQFR